MAKDILFNNDISIVLCDVNCGVIDSSVKVLNAEDVNSAGHDFLTYVLERYSAPVYILQSRDDDITKEEFLSFAKLGVRDILPGIVPADLEEEVARLRQEKEQLG